MLAAECAAIRSALRLDATTPLFPLPQGDWRHWVGHSATVGDNSAWFALRVCMATLMNSVLLGYWTQFGEEHPLRFWFIYLTNWTLCVQCSYLTLAAYCTWRAGLASASESSPPRCLHVLLCLQGVALPGAALVTALFWLLVYPSYPEAAQYAVNYLVHGFNLVVALADLACSSQPFLLVYGALLAPYGITYILFTVLYYALGGMNEWHQPWIYQPIYWGAPDMWKGALLSLGVLVFVIPALVLLFVGVAHIRDAAAMRQEVGEEQGTPLLDAELAEGEEQETTRAQDQAPAPAASAEGAAVLRT